MDSEYLKMHEFSKNRSNTDPWTLYQAITKPRTWFERSSIGITHATRYVSVILKGISLNNSKVFFCRSPIFFGN